MKVWILYEEHGEYSDYRMGIYGVFSTPEKAKEYVAAIVAALPEEPLSDFIPRAPRALTAWERREGAWHATLARVATIGSTGGQYHWDLAAYTIAPYELDEAFDYTTWRQKAYL